MANHKFKVGDRLVASSGLWFPKGTLVTVVAVDDDDHMPYFCYDGKTKLWVNENDLAPASEADKRFEFRAGQRVRIRSWESMEKEFGVDSGGDIRALGAFTKGMRHLCGRSATISNIIGKHVVLKDWDDGSGDTGWCFSTDMLEPAGFEAGQIEEGIKKYDADHAEKKPGVKKVKRHAKAGEYVKIVNQCCNWGYQNGDILRVIKEWNGTSVICEGARICVGDSEYVVLEGYKPEQKEERRKAKVGDTIKIICDCGGYVKPGTVWQVSSAGEGGNLILENKQHGGEFVCSYGNYVVLNSGKHVYTDVEIGEAKRFVLHTICTLAEKDVHVIFSHASGDENDDSAFSCYILDHGASMDADDDGFTADAERYNSVCSENDEPNEWVGKAVALCKALHKSLPDYVR